MIKTVFTDNDNIVFKTAEPFPHIVFDNFFENDVAKTLYSEIPELSSDVWFQYNNKIENKYTCNHWDRFPITTYKVLSYLASLEFTEKISKLTGIFPLVADIGLHGGGWHVHTRGGLLNVHKDYSMHPKLKLERALNIIIYLTPDWQPSWGGSLGLWTEQEGQPDKLIRNVDCLFNRALLFDTRKNSWHGLPESIQCPEDIRRTSIALYYLTTPSNTTDPRERALFAPSEWQRGDTELENFILNRSKV